jgi:ubiquitin C-terminal hydrolase
MTYFKKKKFHLSERPILKFINTKAEKKKHQKIKKNAFSKIVLYIFCHSKTTWSKVIFKNFVKITGL